MRPIDMGRIFNGRCINILKLVQAKTTSRLRILYLGGESPLCHTKEFTR